MNPEETYEKRITYKIFDIEICDKCNGKGYWYNYGHCGEGDYYHECDKCHSTGYLKKKESEE